MLVWEKKLGLALFGASLMLAINAMVVMSDYTEQSVGSELVYLQNGAAVESFPVGNTQIHQGASPRSSRNLS